MKLYAWAVFIAGIAKNLPCVMALPSAEEIDNGMNEVLGTATNSRALTGSLEKSIKQRNKRMEKSIKQLNKRVTYACNVHIANHDDWLNQCAYYFKKGGWKPNESMQYLKDYYFKDQERGLCTIALSGAFKNMQWNSTIQQVLDDQDLLTAKMADVKSSLPPLELPAIVSFPHTARDAVKVVKFAKKQQMKVSIVNSGHSYSGQSTRAESILLNMRSYPKYSKNHVFECEKIDKSSKAYAPCKLAVARGKSAVVRVGGGEGNDDIYRHLESWNYMVPDREKRYDVLAGAEGTVGLGWLAGGGLGSGQEREWGVGVDQVLEIEMVLPTGEHVKFGPEKWKDKPGYIYPQTSKVKGYCNKNVQHHESDWEWGECDNANINFEDLWFAVRGGGGGSWGVVLSVYYQLHDQLPQYYIKNGDLVQNGNAILLECNTTSDDCAGVLDKVQTMWIDFLLDFLYNPTALQTRVDTDLSNRCGYTGGAFDFYSISSSDVYYLICRGEDAANALLDAWNSYVPSSQYLPSGNYVNIVQDQVMSCLIAGGTDVRAKMGLTASSTALCMDGSINPTIDNLLPDEKLELLQSGQGFNVWQTPAGHLLNSNGASSYMTYSLSLLIPVTMISAEKDFMVRFFKGEVSNGHHAMGGNIIKSSDGMAPLPKGYREAALQIGIGFGGGDPDAYEAYISELQKRILFQLGVKDTTDASSFPGFTAVNHQLGWGSGPVKSDWSKPCPLKFTEEKRRKHCMTVQETEWGTENLKRLEQIKTDIDPKNRFTVHFGVKNDDVVGSPLSIGCTSDGCQTT